MNYSNHKTTQMNLPEVDHTVCLLTSLLNDQRYPKLTQLISYEMMCLLFSLVNSMNKKGCILVKYKAYCVCLNHCQMSECTPNQHS